MIAEERAYAEALAAGIAEDIRAHPPDGLLVRAVLRWFEHVDPLYFTVHALGADERSAAEGVEWTPQDWDNADREFERSDRIVEQPELERTGSALGAVYEPYSQDEFDDHFGPEDDPPPAILEAVRLLPAALEKAGVARSEDFAVAAAHFEGDGARRVLEATASPELLKRLEAAGEMPED